MASSRGAPSNLNVIIEDDEEQEVDSLNQDTVEGGSGVLGSKKGKRKVRRTSDVWNIFDLRKENDEEGKIIERAYCKYCPKIYTATSSCGTTHLKRHIPKCPGLNSGHVDPRQTTLNFTPDGNLGTFTYDPNRARELHAKYIASAQLPLGLAEDPAFEEYIRQAYNPQFKAVSRNTIRADCIKTFTEMRQKLIHEFNTFHASVACTSDIWTGRTRSGYICVTAHYVDRSWQFQKRLIAFRQIPYPHDAQVIYHTIMEIFDLYGIKEKVLSITFDNAAISLFKQTLKPHYGGSFFHQRCACHIINLVVQDGMKQFEVYLDNVRAALSFISSSGTRMQEFVQNIQWFGMTPKWLPTIVPNRWNAAYLMLEVALSYKDMVTTYYNGRNADRLLTEADWQICQCFYYFLKVFYDATVTLSGVYYPTSHHALHKLYDIANAFEMHRDVEIFSATVAFMENKFKKY